MTGLQCAMLFVLPVETSDEPKDGQTPGSIGGHHTCYIYTCPQVYKSDVTAE